MFEKDKERSIKKKSKVYKFIETHDFKCQRCSNCCRKDPGVVMMTKHDVKIASNALSMTIPQFLDQCCRAVYRFDGAYVALKEKANFDCIFWNEGCMIYENRPIQCRTFPYWPSVVESEESWQKEKKRCPGLDKPSGLTVEERYKCYLYEKKARYMKMPNTFRSFVD